jgi:hypothetical protein
MGTRSTTSVIDVTYGDPAPLCTLYRQYDGYERGHGKQLADFLSKLTLVNGLSGDNENVANGAGCLAAQMIAHFKTEPGGFYMDKPSSNHTHDYGYNVIINNTKITVEVYAWSELIFAAPLSEFSEWCSREND